MTQEELKGASERVFDAVFSDLGYKAINPENQPEADTLTKIFRFVLIEKIEKAIRG
jgi:hypothetical protein